jgi:hypothetical protein
MFIETHGEVCRLGYLKVALAVEETLSRESKSRATVTEAMLGFLRWLPIGYEAGSRNGVVSARSSIQTVRGYVILAGQVLTPTLKRTLRLLSAYESVVEECLRFNRGLRPTMTHMEVLNLTTAEKILYTYALSISDPLFVEVARWTAGRDGFKRAEYFHEALSKIIPEVAVKYAKPGVGERILEKARRFFEEYQSLCPNGRVSQAWIRTRSYNFCRHVLSPRVEWLVDLGLLTKKLGKKGCKGSFYEPTGKLRHCADAISELTASGDVVNYAESIGKVAYAFSEECKLSTSFLPLLSSHQNYASVLSEVYGMLSGDGLEMVAEADLMLATVVKLADTGLRVSVGDVKNMEDTLKLMYMANQAYVKPDCKGRLVAITNIRQLR